jgi:hypothetical protein
MLTRDIDSPTGGYFMSPSGGGGGGGGPKASHDAGR